MRTIIVAVFILFTIFAGTVAAGGYKITRVIDVGPADLDPMVWPLKWSPDGTKLAFFYDGVLNICDTLGKNINVVPFDIRPHRYEWLSNYELIIHLHKYCSDNRGPRDSSRLVQIDILTRAQKTLEEFTRGPGYVPDDPKSFSGPYRSARGNIFYLNNVMGRVVLPGTLTIHYFTGGDKAGISRIKPADDHYYGLHPTGLYKIRGNLRDSALVAPSPVSYPTMSPAISPDEQYYMVGGQIYRFADSTWINLNYFIPDSSRGNKGIDYLYYSFNPVRLEVLVTTIHGIDEEHDSTAVGVFDLATKVFTFVDPLIGMTMCNTPSYAPDGAKIALLSHGRLYIVYREEYP